MRTLITDIYNAIDSGADDTALDVIIQQHIDDYALTTTVAQFRIDNYTRLRRWAYPDPADRFDADVKFDYGSRCDDPGVQAEGQAQLNAYYDACWAVKIRFPKE